MMADVETEDALCEFDFLVTEDNDRLVSEQSHRNGTESSKYINHHLSAMLFESCSATIILSKLCCCCVVS